MAYSSELWNSIWSRKKVKWLSEISMKTMIAYRRRREDFFVAPCLFGREAQWRNWSCLSCIYCTFPRRSWEEKKIWRRNFEEIEKRWRGWRIMAKRAPKASVSKLWNEENIWEAESLKYERKEKWRNGRLVMKEAFSMKRKWWNEENKKLKNSREKYKMYH